MSQQTTFFDQQPVATAQPVEPTVVVTLPKQPIILLDLNFTLVANSHLKQRQPGLTYVQKIAYETYRQWLVDLIRDHRVLLCTVRYQQYQQVTLDHIRSLTGWLPEAAFFNPTTDYRGYIVKDAYLREHIFQQYGSTDEQAYFAIESATQTRAMYKRHGIAAAPVGNAIWSSLPYRLQGNP